VKKPVTAKRLKNNQRISTRRRPDPDTWIIPLAGSIIHMLPGECRKADAVLATVRRMLDGGRRPGTDA
jgi:hypothetical protein